MNDIRNMPTANRARQALTTHGRFAYRPITDSDAFRWPRDTGLAVYLGFNIEHFAFGEGLGAALGPLSPQPDVLNHSWREYGNRVGAWRCIELFDQLALPAGTLINTALYDHCPALIAACVARGDELIGHGHTNAHRQSELDERGERELLLHCRERIAEESGTPPHGWLSPWISESALTPDLLAETGYRYTLNWCHDDRPVRMTTRGAPLWSIPYPQELNDLPMMVGRHMDGRAFADMIIDQFDEMLEQANRGARPQALVMGIALHPYLVGQPYRLRHLRRALEHLAAARARGDVWITTPGAIASHMDDLERDGIVRPAAA
ncbi:polysaccharide deacetylase family protein [Paraburkholderia panacisoli]|uniref:Polysaccharide deacetylase family protein n=1 Tax=Paraburkholderia panacisoli TaxID=2603818 RepID=A0A5B0HES7_9BURK|nr:polysaccharide deacetylase family protein [Paraburkholderia panacisoli]KAA1013755.1 polysaccharide deacetylase family protein [Paraburkholderia panacisoli]